MNARLDMSISRLFFDGPLSVISTTTDLPFARLVTLTFVPKESFRCAAVSLLLLKRSPLAVFLPLKLSA
jgi:hypothetical protein